MAKDNGTRVQQMRERITHLAARLMAEDGIEDFALAKRKAARQAGAPDTRNLPTNEEIEQALRSYRQLYQPDEHRERLIHLRKQTLLAMKLFEQFNPYLVGSVLNGNAGRYSNIDLHLFVNSAKEIEIFLLNSKIEYKLSEHKFFIGGESRAVPVFRVDLGDIETKLAIFAEDDVRKAIKTSAEGKVLERANYCAVESLLVET